MIRKLFTYISLLFCFSLLAVERNNISSFIAGEKLTYIGYYNWRFVWVKAGEVTFEVSDTVYNNSPAYFIGVYGYTFKAYDLFFKVRDTLEVIMDIDSTLPFITKRITNESSYHAEHNYLFDHKNRTVTTSISKRNKTPKDSIIAWPDGFRDMVSSFYWIRNIDFSKYKRNDTIPLRMVVDGVLERLYIRYKGKENVKLKDGRKFRCLKFCPLLMKGTIFKEGEGMNVYLTDDRNRIPILVESEIKVGVVKGMIDKMENLKWPLDSQIR